MDVFGFISPIKWVKRYRAKRIEKLTDQIVSQRVKYFELLEKVKRIDPYNPADGIFSYEEWRSIAIGEDRKTDIEFYKSELAKVKWAVGFLSYVHKNLNGINTTRPIRLISKHNK